MVNLKKVLNAPDSFAAGNPAKADFVGWTGCGPIQLLIENVIGLQPDAATNTLAWRLRRTDRHGLEKLNLGGNTVSVICDAREDRNDATKIKVKNEKPFTLKVIHPRKEKIFLLDAGEHLIRIN